MQRCIAFIRALPRPAGSLAATRFLRVELPHSLQKSTTAFSTALCTAARPFVQGAPPQSTDKETYTRRKQDLSSSHADEMREKYERRQQEIHEYFATHEPHCPEPLPENAFVKGQFGMRRRYFVDHRGKHDAASVDEAISASVNACRK